MTQYQAPGNPIVANVMRPLSDAASWMRLIGTMAIIYGVVLGLTIIGLIIAWLPIWMGVLLRRAANDADAAHAAGDEGMAVSSLRSLNTIFKVQGVLVLIGLVWLAVSIIGVIVLVAAGDSG